MKNVKAWQRDRLIYEFGILLQPLKALVVAPDPPSPTECRIAVAKVHAGDSAWRKTVGEFTEFTDDISFGREFQDISHVPERLRATVSNLLESSGTGADPNGLRNRLEQELASALENLFRYIERVPIAWEPVVFEANTPFTSYLRIKESIAAVKQRLHYFDRYLKPDFFQLFLALVDRELEIRLVTTAGGVKAVFSISDLARREFRDYQLVEVSSRDLHDRNLLVDDQLFSLGPGVDRAGMALTNFGPADNSQEALQAFEKIMNNGRTVHHS